MSVHLCEVSFEAGFSVNPAFRNIRNSRADMNTVARRLLAALDRAYIGKHPDGLLVDHIDNVRVVKIVGRARTRGASGAARQPNAKRRTAKKK